MRILAVDMDDTCLNSKNRISPKTMDALKKAAAAGIEIVPATVRALSCLPHQLRGMDFIRYVITSNGAQITDLKTNRAVYQSLIPMDTVCEVLKLRKAYGIVATIHVQNEVIIQGLLPTLIGRLSCGKDTAGVLYRRDLVKYLRQNRLDVESLQMFPVAPNSRAKTMALIEKEYPQLVADSDGNHLDIYLRGNTKGAAIAALAKHLSVAKEDIVCIGDNTENDSTMFAVSGLKFAMGNAEQTLKDMADYVVAGNDEDGVAEAIEKYLL